MNKKALFIIFLILIGAVGLLFYNFSKPIPKKEVAINTESSAEGELKLQEQAAEIIKSKDFFKCNEISNPTYRVVCINNIALNLAQETGDLSHCEKIDNKLIPQEDCERQIIFTKSVEKEDIRVCGETKNEALKKECEAGLWQSLAFKKEDSKLCENISTEYDQNYCYDNLVFNKEFLNNASGFDCGLFRDEKVQNDCNKYKKDTIGKEGCVNLTSSLFLSHCLANNINF